MQANSSGESFPPVPDWTCGDMLIVDNPLLPEPISHPSQGSFVLRSRNTRDGFENRSPGDEFERDGQNCATCHFRSRPISVHRFTIILLLAEISITTGRTARGFTLLPTT